MRISDIKIIPIEGRERLKAFVSLKIENSFMIRDLKLIQGDTGYFLAMPSRVTKEGVYIDIVHPLNSFTRRQLEEEVVKEYQRLYPESGIKLRTMHSGKKKDLPNSVNETDNSDLDLIEAARTTG